MFVFFPGSSFKTASCSVCCVRREIRGPSRNVIRPSLAATRLPTGKDHGVLLGGHQRQRASQIAPLSWPGTRQRSAAAVPASRRRRRGRRGRRRKNIPPPPASTSACMRSRRPGIMFTTRRDAQPFTVSLSSRGLLRKETPRHRVAVGRSCLDL